MADFDLDAEVQRLVRTIAKLMRTAPGGWVSWRKVSKEQEGAEEFAERLSALAGLPSYARYFVFFRNKVKLTEEGLRLAQKPPPKLSRIEEIANAVREYASTLDRLRLRVVNVSTVARSNGRFIQAVEVELDESFFHSETPVDLCPLNGGSITHGRVVGQEADGGVVYVAFDSEVLRHQLPAVLTVDRGFLLHRLGEQLDRLQDIPRLVDPLFNAEGSSGDVIRSSNSVTLANRLAGMDIPWMRFLWGPPGSGKTFALARLAAQILRREADSRILLVAPANRAVDVAIEQLISQIEDFGLHELIECRKILRFGYPRLPQIIGYPELRGPADLDEFSKRERKISREISKAEREQKPERDIARLRAELLAAQEEIKAAVYEHIKQSAVVATTITLAYLESSPIWNLEWNTVLVDEATMVPPATGVFLGSLAKNRFLIAGDPRQLGPVFEDKPSVSPRARGWMGRDVFETSGVSSGSGEDRQIKIQDPRLAQIISQRRCPSGIWSKVQHLYPRIQSLVDLDAIQRLIDLPPLPGQAIVILNTSDPSRHVRCEKVHQSWKNENSADLAMEVAGVLVSEASRDTSIAIISPYRAQNRLLRKSIRAERSNNDAFDSVEAGTIHQFQGSDADIVIFDVVDGVGRYRLGNLLRGDTGIRLVNVAVTRAKGKVVVLADKSWFRASVDRSDNPLLWNLVMDVDGQPVSPPAPDGQSDLCESPIEKTLYEAMKEKPDLTSVKVQYIIRDNSDRIISRADFAFPDVKYAVYCDGAQWHLRRDCWQRDLRQRNELTAIGWVFSVFSGSEVKRDPQKCAAKVAETRRNLLRRRNRKH